MVFSKKEKTIIPLVVLFLCLFGIIFLWPLIIQVHYHLKNIEYEYRLEHHLSKLYEIDEKRVMESIYLQNGARYLLADTFYAVREAAKMCQSVGVKTTREYDFSKLFEALNKIENTSNRINSYTVYLPDKQQKVINKILDLQKKKSANTVEHTGFLQRILIWVAEPSEYKEICDPLARNYLYGYDLDYIGRLQNGFDETLTNLEKIRLGRETLL